jgi:hypothetical protein
MYQIELYEYHESGTYSEFSSGSKQTDISKSISVVKDAIYSTPGVCEQKPIKVWISDVLEKHSRTCNGLRQQRYAGS